MVTTIGCFLADCRCGHPDELLEETLAFLSNHRDEKVDATYLLALNNLLLDYLLISRRRLLDRFGNLSAQFCFPKPSLETFPQPNPWRPRGACGKLDIDASFYTQRPHVT